MGIIVTVTGGMRSGKSTFAELLAKEKGGRDVLYIATMKPIDEECIERIKKHRDRRPKDWLTVEVYSDIDVVIARSGKKVGILDCLTNMVSNIMMEIDLSWDNVTNDIIADVGVRIREEIEKMVCRARENLDTFIVVTNEVGMGIIPDTKLGRIFTEYMGEVNKLLVELSDEVYFMISGIPLKIKG